MSNFSFLVLNSVARTYLTQILFGAIFNRPKTILAVNVENV